MSDPSVASGLYRYFKIARLQDCKIAANLKSRQKSKIARLQDCKIARLQDCKSARVQDKLEVIQDCKIARLQYFKTNLK